ncbi:MAG: hypothetical protein ACKOEO_23345, partial [Planctomycetaceae bacterium]
FQQCRQQDKRGVVVLGEPGAALATRARTVTGGLTSTARLFPDGTCRQEIEQEDGERRESTLDFLHAPAVSSPLSTLALPRPSHVTGTLPT